MPNKFAKFASFVLLTARDVAKTRRPLQRRQMHETNMESKPNFDLIDAIVSEAYLMTMISCVLCENDLMASDIDLEEANDPMDVWAEEFSSKARKKGWSVSPLGSIVCPNCNE